MYKNIVDVKKMLKNKDFKEICKNVGLCQFQIVTKIEASQNTNRIDNSKK